MRSHKREIALTTIRVSWAASACPPKIAPRWAVRGCSNSTHLVRHSRRRTGSRPGRVSRVDQAVSWCRTRQASLFSTIRSVPTRPTTSVSTTTSGPPRPAPRPLRAPDPQLRVCRQPPVQLVLAPHARLVLQCLRTHRRLLIYSATLVAQELCNRGGLAM